MIRAGLLGLVVCAGAVLAEESAVDESVASAVASAPKASAVKAKATSGLKTFDEVVKDTRRHEGFVTVWQQDEKYWLELKPSDLNKRFLLVSKLRQGIGESFIYGGAMLNVFEVEFRRIHNQIQLVAFNPVLNHDENKRDAVALAAAYSPSLLGSGAVVSQPHAQRKSFLVEANAIFLPDLMGAGLRLNQHYRQNYTLDARNSAITKTRTGKDGLVLEVQQHFFAPILQSAVPNGPSPSIPRQQPDPRSLFLTFNYTLQALPADPIRPRLADQRLGYFTTRVNNLVDETARSPVRHYVNRWRLEKKDPAAALSEPLKPIVFWLDQTIPEQHRQAVREGILEWNKAFERIGFKNAIEVRVADDKTDTLDMQHASVRWLADQNLPFSAIGPIQVDPRTGEILDADVAIQGASFRGLRQYRLDRLGGSISMNFADFMAEQTAYAQDVMSARGDLSDAEFGQYQFDYLKSLTIHEIGHALGLRHNFRASSLYSAAQLADPTFSREHGVSGSIMDYFPVNLPLPGQPKPAPFQTVLGPYDYWAIEYAYKPLAPESEKAELQKIAARSNEPALAFGTDEDAHQGIDPEVLQVDLGNNPLVFARNRIAIAKDLIARQSHRVFKADEDYADQRRSIVLAMNDLGLATGILARQIGGVKTLRDLPGSGRDPIQVLDPAIQRGALALLASEILSADSFKLPPSLLRQASVDYLGRSDTWMMTGQAPFPNFSLAEQSLGVQKIALDRIFNDVVLGQILDSNARVGKGQALGLPELWARTEEAIWSELKQGGEIPALRRDLQREYVNRVVNLLLKPSALSRADARALLRAQAKVLLKQLVASKAHRGAESDAHLLDCREQLQQALSAQMVRAGA